MKSGQRTPQEEKDRQKESVIQSAAMNSYATPSFSCTANTCTVNIPNAPSGLPMKQLYQSNPFISSTLADAKDADGHAIDLPDDYSFDHYKTVVTNNFIGGMATTFTVDYLTQYLREKQFSNQSIYWLSQIPQAAFMYCLGASPEKIAALPVANYLLTKICCMKEKTATYLTTAVALTIDVLHTPVSLIATGIGANAAGAKVGNFLYEKSKNLVSNSLFAFKNCATRLSRSLYSEPQVAVDDSATLALRR